ncbi:hypothetical protein FH972_025227 [Carpinus fangiana]|uniref:TEA domain-containing protein n=1 Tax=Carpinus fangiana TaxID=176857 RepID=A0A5N6L0R7_9ROSI|nr:hypothetical protein FH972_025227 [Carpinus fangiana]
MDVPRESIIPHHIDLFHHRALQERSPNPRHDNDYGSSRYGKCHVHSERPIPGRSDATIQIYRRHDLSQRNNSGINKPKLTPFEREQVFQKLWMRLWRCDSFAKYRLNQKRGARRAKDQIWSDRNEYLFFRGLVEFWPTGRVQQIDDRFEPKKNTGKPEFGRNELIARWMGQELSHEVKRKEISSHLQVLKAKVRSEAVRDDYGLDTKKEEYKYMETMPRLVPHRVQRDAHVLEPVQFDIRIRESDLYGRVDNTAHVLAYSTASAKKEDQYLAAMPVWRRDFPELSAILDDAHHWGVEIMLVDSPLGLVNGAELRNIRTAAGSKNCDVDLSIQNKFRIRSHVSSSEEWVCTTTFFSKGEIVDLPGNQVPIPVKTDTNHTHWDGEYQTLMIPFKSDYWLEMICKFADRLENPLESASVEQDVEDMLAVQEIRKHQMSDEGEDSDDWTTVLVILWKFHVSDRERPSPTTWRSVFLPFESMSNTRSEPFESGADASADENIDSAFDALPVANEYTDHQEPLHMASHGGPDHRQRYSLTQAGFQVDDIFGDMANYDPHVVNMSTELIPHDAINHPYDPHLLDPFRGLVSPTQQHSTQMSAQPSQDSYYSQFSHSQPSEPAEDHTHHALPDFALDPFHSQPSSSFHSAPWFDPPTRHTDFAARHPASTSFAPDTLEHYDYLGPAADLAASGWRLQQLAAAHQPLHPRNLPPASSGAAATAHAGPAQPYYAYKHAPLRIQTVLPSQPAAEFPLPGLASADAVLSPRPVRSSPRHRRSAAVSAPLVARDSCSVSPTNRGSAAAASSSSAGLVGGVRRGKRGERKEVQGVEGRGGGRKRRRVVQDAGDAAGEVETDVGGFGEVDDQLLSAFQAHHAELFEGVGDAAGSG